MLQSRHVQVQAFGQLVVAEIAGFPFTLEFDAALTLSAAIRMNARLAKLSTGNTERGFYCRGVLTDAAAKPFRQKRFQRLPARLKRHDLFVDVEGQLVTITIQGIKAKMPYPDAREFAQWLRIRGKEAKRNAGEFAHWSTFTSEHVCP